MTDDIVPAGYHNEGARANGRRVNDISDSEYQWKRKRLPTPGAMNYAFESLGLVEFTPIGDGIGNRHQYQITQPPQVYINGIATWTDGLGGIIAGQAIMQPLIDPYNETYG